MDEDGKRSDLIREVVRRGKRLDEDRQRIVRSILEADERNAGRTFAERTAEKYQVDWDAVRGEQERLQMAVDEAMRQEYMAWQRRRASISPEAAVILEELYNAGSDITSKAGAEDAFVRIAKGYSPEIQQEAKGLAFPTEQEIQAANLAGMFPSNEQRQASDRVADALAAQGRVGAIIEELRNGVQLQEIAERGRAEKILAQRLTSARLAGHHT